MYALLLVVPYRTDAVWKAAPAEWVAVVAIESGASQLGAVLTCARVQLQHGRMEVGDQRGGEDLHARNDVAVITAVNVEEDRAAALEGRAGLRIEMLFIRHTNRVEATAKTVAARAAAGRIKRNARSAFELRGADGLIALLDRQDQRILLSPARPRKCWRPDIEELPNAATTPNAMILPHEGHQ